MIFMKVQKFVMKNIILIVLLISIFGRLAVSYPLNTNLLEGTDFTAHVPKIWYIADVYDKYGDWNPFWYAGYPFLKYYSPLSYYIAGFFAFFLDPVIAYKVIINIFFLLTPIVFYLFIKDFRLNDVQKAVGILIFSFFITNIYYFWNNAFPTVVNMVFIIFTWIFFKRYVENKNNKYLVFASLFFGLSILVHQLTAFMNIVLILLWIFIRYRKIQFLPIIIGILISSFWFVPFFLDFEKPLFKSFLDFSFFSNIYYHLGMLGVISFLLFSIIFIIISLKEKVDKSFLIILFFILFIIVFSTHNRILAILPIPLSMFIAYFFGRRKALSYFTAVIVIIFALFFYSYHPFSFFGHEKWDIPQAESRVLYIPVSYDFCEGEKCNKFMYSAYLALINNQQIINGWFQETQKIGILNKTKNRYLENISSPLDFSDKEYYNLLQKGFVNSIIVNKHYPEYLKYFENSSYFKKSEENEHFILFKYIGNLSFIEINDIPVNYTISREKNKLVLWFKCSPGTLVIKESYDKNLRIYDNFKSKYIDYDINEYGFIKLNLSESEGCMFTLKYDNNLHLFLPLSIFSLILISFIRFKKK